MELTSKGMASRLDGQARRIERLVQARKAVLRDYARRQWARGMTCEKTLEVSKGLKLDILARSCHWATRTYNKDHARRGYSQQTRIMQNGFRGQLGSKTMENNLQRSVIGRGRLLMRGQSCEEGLSTQGRYATLMFKRLAWGLRLGV